MRRPVAYLFALHNFAQIPFPRWSGGGIISPNFRIISPNFRIIQNQKISAHPPLVAELPGSKLINGMEVLHLHKTLNIEKVSYPATL